MRPVAFFFMPYSGGKFLANCLALSRHALVNNSNLAAEDMFYKGAIDDKYYEFKLKSVLASLPKNFLATKVWEEFGDPVGRFVGSDRLLCYIAHTAEQLAGQMQQIPDLRVIRLVNYYRFNEICFNLKSNGGNFKRHKTGFAQWDRSGPAGDFMFDIDTVLNKNAFVAEVKRLYEYLELDDFQPELIEQFQKSYLECQGLDYI